MQKLQHSQQVMRWLSTSLHAAVESESTSAPYRRRPVSWPHSACVSKEHRQPMCMDSTGPVSMLCTGAVGLPDVGITTEHDYRVSRQTRLASRWLRLSRCTVDRLLTDACF